MPVFKHELEAGVTEPVKQVKVTVREEGHGKISTGLHDPKSGEQYFAEGEEFTIDEPIALELKKRYYVDIQKVKATL